jgi:hypothetical protein
MSNLDLVSLDNFDPINISIPLSTIPLCGTHCIVNIVNIHISYLFLFNIDDLTLNGFANRSLLWRAFLNVTVVIVIAIPGKVKFLISLSQTLLIKMIVINSSFCFFIKIILSLLIFKSTFELASW